MERKMSRKKMRSNKAQIRVLVEYMLANKQLAKGELIAPRRQEDQWLKLKDTLKKYGPDRSVDQWKQTWRDLKKNARNENASCFDLAAGDATDNSFDVHVVSDVTKKVLEVIEHENSTDIACIFSEEVIEFLIGKVKQCSCLWDASHPLYRDTRSKDLAWEQIARECGMANGKEAKSLWKNLRDSHREAYHRHKNSTDPNNLKPWKYETLMEFLIPQTQNKAVSPNVLNYSHASINDILTTAMSTDDDLEAHNASLSPLPTESTRKKAKQLATEAVILKLRHQRQEQQQTQRDKLRRKDIDIDGGVQRDSLTNLFTSLLQKMRELPKHLQLRVQREIFESVTRAEEEAISKSSYGCTSAKNQNGSFPDPLLVTKSSPNQSSTLDDGSGEDSEETTEIEAYHLVASSRLGDSSVLLLDSRGCPTGQVDFPPFTRTWLSGTQRLSARFKAFRFPTSHVVRFAVMVRFCDDKCPSVDCGIQSQLRAARQTNDTYYQWSNEVPALVQPASGSNAYDTRYPTDENQPQSDNTLTQSDDTRTRVDDTRAWSDLVRSDSPRAGNVVAQGGAAGCGGEGSAVSLELEMMVRSRDILSADTLVRADHRASFPEEEGGGAGAGAGAGVVCVHELLLVALALAWLAVQVLLLLGCCVLVKRYRNLAEMSMQKDYHSFDNVGFDTVSTHRRVHWPDQNIDILHT